MKIGLLHSLSGRFAVEERSISQGALLATEQVNAAGGVHGEPLEPITADYASDVRLATVRATELFADPGVLACVGGYTSASRLAIRRGMATDRSAILMYPTYFEGFETDPQVHYCGAVPNQFAVDYVRWIVENLGSTLFVLGSDYIYPRTLSAVLRTEAVAAGARIVGDEYVALGETDFSTVVERIGSSGADVVMSNIVGTASTTAFADTLRRAGHAPEQLPVAATVTSEIDLQMMRPELRTGHYMASSYFGALRNVENQRYRAAMTRRFGPGTVTHVTQVGAYNAVWSLALAARQAVSPVRSEVRRALQTVRFDDNPEGWPLSFRQDNYTPHASYIGCATPAGDYEIVAESPLRSPEVSYVRGRGSTDRWMHNAT